MMRQALILVFLLSLLGLALYDDYQDRNARKTAGGGHEAALRQTETKEDYFTYRLVSEKPVYETGEPVQLYAELLYNGPLPSVVIQHSASPFTFVFKDKLGENTFMSFMDQPGMMTTLYRGRPIKQVYDGGVNYGRSGTAISDSSGWKELRPDSFPAGRYTVYGKADFTLGEETPSASSRRFQLEADVAFEVKSDKQG
jgi:hypothetical protein